MTLSVPQRSRSGRRPVRRWDPVSEMADVYARMGRLMQDFFGDATPVTAAVQLPEWTAPADIEETDNGQFEHVVALPGDVDPDKVDASLSDGVLTVRIGKASGSQPRRIEIKSG